MKYLFDTNSCIALLKAEDASLINKVTQLGSDEIAICSVVKAELITGVKKSTNRIKNELRLSTFFTELTSLPFDDAAAEQYALIRAMLERAGTPIGPYDMMIAAIAQSNKLTLVTRNIREFERVSSLAIERW